jgi:hypothetical protein
MPFFFKKKSSKSEGGIRPQNPNQIKDKTE